jgi:hypothetical protein
LTKDEIGLILSIDRSMGKIKMIFKIAYSDKTFTQKPILVEGASKMAEISAELNENPNSDYSIVLLDPVIEYQGDNQMIVHHEGKVIVLYRDPANPECWSPNGIIWGDKWHTIEAVIEGR